jgi:Xaa-Pro aminopeptidase
MASTDTVITPVPRSNANRSTTPNSDVFKSYISSQWADRAEAIPAPRAQAPFAAARRARLSALYKGQRLIIPAGRLKQRSNDTDYAFRAHSAFAHLTGWGSDAEPGAVLVLEPTADGHDATLYFREAAGRESDEFYANAEIGEFWIGPRPSIDQVSADLPERARHRRPASVPLVDSRPRSRGADPESPRRSTRPACGSPPTGCSV